MTNKKCYTASCPEDKQYLYNNGSKICVVSCLNTNWKYIDNTSTPMSCKESCEFKYDLATHICLADTTCSGYKFNNSDNCANDCSFNSDKSFMLNNTCVANCGELPYNSQKVCQDSCTSMSAEDIMNPGNLMCIDNCSELNDSRTYVDETNKCVDPANVTSCPIMDILLKKCITTTNQCSGGYFVEYINDSTQGTCVQ